MSRCVHLRAATGACSPAAQYWLFVRRPLVTDSFASSFFARLLDGPSASNRIACSSLKHASRALLSP
jgi:hypothetical protein